MTVYLAGPIFQCSDAAAKDWRETIKAARPDLTFLDPMARDYRGRELDCVNEIVEGDKADIDASDVVIANCRQASAGTSMEVFYAWQRNVPVIAVVESRVSPWVRYHASKVVTTLDAAIAALPQVAPRDDNRFYDPVSQRNFDGYFDEVSACGCVSFYRGGTNLCETHKP
jgi:nucleoside 2-deoxyribosyltransferase